MCRKEDDLKDLTYLLENIESGLKHVEISSSEVAVIN